MNRKQKQVSLEPYGYTLVPRAPVKSPETKTKVVETKELAADPLPVLGMSPSTDHAEVVRPSTPKSGNSAGCVTLVIIVIVAVISLASLASPSTGTNSSSYSSSNHDAGMACIMAEKLIRPQLKAPSTAEFDYADCKGSATHSGNTWTLRSYVDADNSFGAHIRTRYIVKMTNVPPSDTWRMSDLIFDES